MQSTNIRGYQGRGLGSGIPRKRARLLLYGTSRRCEKAKGPAPGDDSRLGPLIPGGERAH